MTLKEKFNNLVPKEFGGMYEPLLTDCEQIADDYAVEFKDWCDKIIVEDWIDKTTQQLLEIFKKEKGL